MRLCSRLQGYQPTSWPYDMEWYLQIDHFNCEHKLFTQTAVHKSSSKQKILSNDTKHVMPLEIALALNKGYIQLRCISISCRPILNPREPQERLTIYLYLAEKTESVRRRDHGHIC